MKLDDLQTTMQSTHLAQLLEKHYGISVPVDNMNQQQATVTLEGVQNKLNRFRNSSAIHEAEQNQSYLAMVMLEQVLQAKLSEGPKWDALKTVGGAVKQGLKPIASAVKGAGERIKDTHLPSTYGARTSVSDITSRFKAMPKSEPQDVPKISLSTPASGATGIELNKLKYLAQNPSSKNDQLLAAAFRGMMAHPKFSTAMASLKKPMQESLDLMESSVGEAEVVLAAKDLADRIQDMVETLGKMVNEELPALSETIRDTMDSEQADAFTSTATDTINGLLDNVRGAKETLDGAARVLAGEESAQTDDLGTQEPMDDADLTDTTIAEPDETPEPQEPLGRGKR
jgi:hypothetical protein